MRPRVLLYYFTISVLSFIPFYCVIPCLILSSLPLSLVLCHLLGGPIPSPCFPVLYPCFHGPCRPFVLVIHRHPYSCLLNPFVFHSPPHAVRSGVYPFSPCLRVRICLPLVGPCCSPLQPLLVGFSFLEETCVMRPWHHQAAKLLVYF